MNLCRENIANAVAFAVGYALFPVTFVWCGGDLSSLPFLPTLAVGIPLGFTFAFATHRFYKD
jgi:hypothetical protein